jgi:16S rRNA (guanine527-N7)-methyltransferase
MSSSSGNGHPTGVPVPRRGEDDAAVSAALQRVLLRSQELGFLGPGDVAVHVRNARAFLVVLDHHDPVEGPGPATGPIADPLHVLDLGSGGGVPGLVMAVERPDLHVALLDAAARRVDFLTDAVEELRLVDRVRVLHGRAEELARDQGVRRRFDVVTARSFGPPAITAECAAGFLRGPGSRLIVSEPPDESGDRWPAEGLRELGLRPHRREHVEATTLQEIVVERPVPDRFPRRVGVPAKRPLFH